MIRTKLLKIIDDEAHRHGAFTEEFRGMEHKASYALGSALLLEPLLLALDTLKTKTHHNECEDGFYSCPKAENFYGSSDTKCNCGADSVIEALASIEKMLEAKDG
jgi:hypothetical protein